MSGGRSRLDDGLEELLRQYTESIGSATGGVPSELVQGVTRIALGEARVLLLGPADCTAPERPEEDEVFGKHEGASAPTGTSSAPAQCSLNLVSNSTQTSVPGVSGEPEDGWPRDQCASTLDV